MGILSLCGVYLIMRQTGQSRCSIAASRKVRTPQGRVAANSRPVNVAKQHLPRNRATETSLQRGCFTKKHTGTAISVRRGVKHATALQGETRQPLSGATPNRHT